MVKAILLSPSGEPQMVKVKKNDYRDIKRLLNIESPITVATRKIGDKYFDLWIDDEGLFKEEADGTINACAFCSNAIEILAGNILIANSNGENIASLTDEDIELIKHHLKRISKDFMIDYNTSIGRLKMKFLKEGVFLEYQV